MTVQVIVNQGALDLSNIPEGTQVVVVQQIVQQPRQQIVGREPTNLASDSYRNEDNSGIPCSTHLASSGYRQYRR